MTMPNVRKCPRCRAHGHHHCIKLSRGCARNITFFWSLFPEPARHVFAVRAHDGYHYSPQLGSTAAVIGFGTGFGYNSTENYGRRCLTPLSPHHHYILSLNGGIPKYNKVRTCLSNRVKSSTDKISGCKILYSISILFMHLFTIQYTLER